MVWEAEADYAYRAGYDNRGQVSVTHVVNERGYSVMLLESQPEDCYRSNRQAYGPVIPGHSVVEKPTEKPEGASTGLKSTKGYTASEVFSRARPCKLPCLCFIQVALSPSAVAR